MINQVLLDTSAYSALRRGHPEILGIIRRSDRIVFNPVIIGELLAGFKKGSRAGTNMSELSRLLESPRVTVVDITYTTAECYALIFDGLRKAGKPVPEHDVWISASAMEHGLLVVTTDHHFENVSQVRTEIFQV